MAELRKIIAEIERNKAKRRDNFNVTQVSCGEFTCTGCDRKIKETETIVSHRTRCSGDPPFYLCLDCIMYVWQQLIEKGK